MLINIEDLLFDIDQETNIVSLCIGPVSVEVCKTPYDFKEFAEKLKEKIDKISMEITNTE
jgi:hypothetical protein